MSIVLIAEDDEGVRVLTQSVVEEMGHIGLTAANIEEAMALLNGDRVIALLIADLDMASNPMAGVQLARDAVRIRQGLPVLYTSGAVTDGTRALFVEGSDFLPKPYTVPELTEAVTRMLGATAANSGD
jgi:DNA-binding NtrC family response regulator